MKMKKLDLLDCLCLGLGLVLYVLVVYMIIQAALGDGSTP